MKKNEKDASREYQIIKGFSKISISGICRKLKLNRCSIMNGDAKLSDIQKVKEELESEIAKIFIKK